MSSDSSFVLFSYDNLRLFWYTGYTVEITTSKEFVVPQTSTDVFTKAVIIFWSYHSPFEHQTEGFIEQQEILKSLRKWFICKPEADFWGTLSEYKKVSIKPFHWHFSPKVFVYSRSLTQWHYWYMYLHPCSKYPYLYLDLNLKLLRPNPEAFLITLIIYYYAPKNTEKKPSEVKMLALSACHKLT